MGQLLVQELFLWVYSDSHMVVTTVKVQFILLKVLMQYFIRKGIPLIGCIKNLNVQEVKVYISKELLECFILTDFKLNHTVTLKTLDLHYITMFGLPLHYPYHNTVEYGKYSYFVANFFTLNTLCRIITLEDPKSLDLWSLKRLNPWTKSWPIQVMSLMEQGYDQKSLRSCSLLPITHYEW